MPASRSCLSCGYRLAGLTVLRCPECGRAFDPGAVESFGVRLGNPELLLELDMEWLGEALRAELLDAEILCVVEHSLSGVTGISARRRVRIYVDAEDFERARAFVERRRLERAHPAEGELWRCPRCGEEVPGDFERCWSCGSTASEPARAANATTPAVTSAGAGAGAGVRATEHGAARRGRGTALLLASGFLGVAGAAILARGEPGAALLLFACAACVAVAGVILLATQR